MAKRDLRILTLIDVAAARAARASSRRIAWIFLLVVLVCASGTLVKADDVPPNTGSCTSRANCAITQDKNYLIISDSTQSTPVTIPSGGLPAYLVKAPLALFWAGDASGVPGTGGAWIAPAADQGNTTTHSIKGTTVYQLTFTVTDENKANLGITVAADDFLVITLANSATGSTPATIFTSTGAMYSYTVAGTLDKSSSRFITNPAQPFNTIGLKNGTNALYFLVTNGGPGPTGLSVAFHGTLGGPPVTGVSAAIATSGGTAVKDPIDSATGQFYDTVTDLELGGPLSLQFARYYSSALSLDGFSSGLGLNWMTNFDVSLAVTGTAAKVLLFGGKVVSFTNSGNVWQLQSPLEIVYQLAASGTGFKFMDPNTRLIYTFSASGALTRIEDRNGNAITVTPGPFGPTLISDGAGRTLTLGYSAGQLVQVVDQGTRTFTYAHNGTLLTTATDDAKKVTTYSYVASSGIGGLLVSKQLPLGNTPTIQSYDSTGRVISQTDGNKNVTKIAYDGTGGTTVTNPLGAIKQQTTDSVGNLTAQTDPAGSAKLTLDTANRLTSVTDRLGRTTAMSSHAPTGYPASTTDALGNTTTYSYTAKVQDVFTFYNPTGISYANGTSEAFTYDPTGNMLTHTARDGSVTTFTYDTNGRLLTRTNPSKATTTYTWNTDSTVATETDPVGNQTAFGYDSLKRLLKVTDPNGGVSTFGYATAGDGSHLTFAQPAGIGSTTLYYDFNGQPQDFVNEFGGVFHSVYTNTDNLSTITDPLGRKTTLTYNGTDQLASITDPTGVALSATYDSAGRVASVSDASGKLATYAYTLEGRVASITDAVGNITSYTFDAAGQESGMIMPAGGKIAYGYDKLGNPISATDPLGGVQTLTLDALGRVIQVSMPGGITTSVTRDPQGRPTALITANGNKWSYVYDAAGRIASVTDPLGNATSYVYLGTQLTQIKSPLGAVALITDKAGHVTKRAYADGAVINTGYDSSGQIISADNLTIKRDTKGQPTNINGIGITVDGAGRPATLTYASGKAITYAYDLSGRLASIVDWVAGKTSLTYDAAGRLASLTYPNGATNTYSYDANRARIKIGFGSLGSISLTLDAAGKITAADRNLPQTPSVAGTTSQQFSYDAAGQLSSATYDALGRVTKQSGRTYTWNLASQLTSFVDGSNSASFTYDGLDEINSMTSGSATRSFVFNYLFTYPALSIVRQGGSDLRYYVYTPDGKLLYSIEADNTRRFYHFDEMGNTVMLSDASGALSDGYAITPYGEIAAHSGTADNPFTWQGQFGVYQEGTALFNVRSRHYDASTARFVSRDSVVTADPRSSEPYAYANGNPLLFTDPFGTVSKPTCTPSAEVIATFIFVGVQALTPLQVHTFLACEISTGRLKVDDFGLQIWLAEFDASIRNNNKVSWKGVATDFELDNNDPAPIFTFLKAEVQAVLAKAKTETKAAQAAVTPVAKTTLKILSVPDTAKPTPVAAPAGCGLCQLLQQQQQLNAQFSDVDALMVSVGKGMSAAANGPGTAGPLSAADAAALKLLTGVAAVRILQ